MHLPQGRAAREQDVAAGGLTLWGTKTLLGNRVTLHRSRAGAGDVPAGEESELRASVGTALQRRQEPRGRGTLRDVWTPEDSNGAGGQDGGPEQQAQTPSELPDAPRISRVDLGVEVLCKLTRGGTPSLRWRSRPVPLQLLRERGRLPQPTAALCCVDAADGAHFTPTEKGKQGSLADSGTAQP